MIRGWRWTTARVNQATLSKMEIVPSVSRENHDGRGGDVGLFGIILCSDGARMPYLRDRVERLVF